MLAGKGQVLEWKQQKMLRQKTQQHNYDHTPYSDSESRGKLTSVKSSLKSSASTLANGRLFLLIFILGVPSHSTRPIKALSFWPHNVISMHINLA